MQHKLAQFNATPRYFMENPHKLLDNEAWVKKIARQWAQRAKRDDEFVQKTISGEIAAEVMTVKYEDLHKDTEPMRKSLYRFLSLDPDIAEPLDSGGVRTKAGHMREDPTKFLRKGEVGDWKNYFDKKIHSWFNSVAEQMLNRHGYV